jgi:hypothetical protein
MQQTVADHNNLQYSPTVMTERCHNTLQYFFKDPLNIFKHLLFKISILAWTCFMYCPLYVLVVWFCKIRRVVGRGEGQAHVVYPKWEKILRGSTVLRTCMEICAVWTFARHLIVYEDGQYDSVVWRQVGYQISDTVVCCWHTYSNVHLLGYIHLSIDGAVLVIWISKIIEKLWTCFLWCSIK